VSAAPPPSRPAPPPRTVEGAHQRLDAHDLAIGSMGELMEQLRDAFGTAPNAITGKPGSGVLLYLDRLTREREQGKLLEEHESAQREKWRRRWTLLAGVVAFVATVVALLDRLGVFRS
jgi:hypothetical protein